MLTRSLNRRIMVLTAFLDGSGTVEDPNCAHVTLAGVSASPKEWSNFEENWKLVLTRHNAPLSDKGIPYWHSKEAFQARGGYKGWEIDDRWGLAVALMGVLHEMPLDTVVLSACTVNKADYDSVKIDIPKLLSIERLCVDWCILSAVDNALKRGDKGKPVLELVFDYDEPYERVALWTMKHGVPWSRQVSGVTRRCRMKQSYPMQAADLLAYIMTRHYKGKEKPDWPELAPAMYMVAPLNNILFDSRTLRTWLDENGNYRDGEVHSTPLRASPIHTVQFRERFPGV